MNIFIFDVDDTLILHNQETNDYYNTYNDGELSKLVKTINVDHIYIYTNGTYSHGYGIVKNLLLNNIIPVNNIFGRDNNKYMKPDIRSYNNINEIINNRISNKTKEIYFFDDLIENLVTAKQIGWKTIWISPDFVDKPHYIDYAFPNIFQALMYFTEII